MKLIANIQKLLGRIFRNLFLFFNRWRFKHVGTKVRVYKPLSIDGIENITLENNVTVHKLTWLAAMPLTGNNVQLIIQEGTTIGHFNHIYATNSVIIERNVLTADKVYISDNLHSYEDIELPVLKQPIKQCSPVVIGEGSWIGENVCVIGASIGKHCVVGANSVVTHDIPDYSIAVGVPARVIKKYNFSSQKWDSI